MNPDSNFSRDMQPQVMSITASNNQMMDGMDQEMAEVVKGHNENQHVMKLRHQLEFYMGDSNLMKDHFL